MSPFDVTLVVSIAVLAFYAVNGLRHFDRTQSFTGFFLNDRNLTHGNVRNTFTGAAVSISTVLSFFLTLGVLFGWQIFWSPFTLVAGVIVFAHLVYPRLLANTALYSALRGEGDRPVESLDGLIYFLYGSRWLARTVAGISGVGILAILVAEMMVGVTIYQEYFLRPEYIVFIIAATLFVYAGLGGMRSVVETDRWQVWLISLSLLAILVLLWVQEGGSSPPPSPGFHDLFSGSTWSPELAMPLALFANMVVVNLCFLPSSLRVWQVVVGSAKASRFQVGLWQATVLITLVSVAGVLISRVMLGRLGHRPELSEILGFLATSDGWAAYVVYPFFIIALLSALVSTADSAILPLSQALASRTKEGWTPLRNLRNIFVLVALAVGAYFVVTRLFNLGLVQWILTVFSVTTCIAPTVVAPLFLKDRLYSSISLVLIGAGAVGGFVVAFVWSVVFGDDLSVQPWNCVVGFAISLVLTVIGCLASPRKPAVVRGGAA
jgi:Na+/proline symporter